MCQNCWNKIVLSQLLEHLEDNNLWHVFQSAYRWQHSTETALLRVFDDLLTSSDSDHISVLTLLDLSAAFNTIDHDLLLNRLRAVFGIRDTALVFFGSYLSGRKQLVSVLGQESEPSSLLYGVPQGSVLSLILFILYTQPLSDIIERHSVLHYMFAHHTELYDSAPRSSTDSLFCNIQNCVSDVKKWTIHNKLQLNEDKTEALLFDPSSFSDLPGVLRIGQCDIPFCYSAHNRGVMFNSGLTMKQQVNRICQNLPDCII